MAKFLIEVPHEATPAECAMTIQIFMQSGSHFVTQADWGCMDGQHKTWLTVEAETKEMALNFLPPAYRSRATITGLNRFTLEQADELLARHTK